MEKTQSAFPERDQSKPAEDQGMFRKFDIRRVDGSDQPGGKHHGCRYFVLDLTHDQHAPAAMRAYAAACKETHPQLAADIEREFGVLAAAAPVAAPDDAKDAARWRAFLDSARIKMWGSAGLSSPQPNHYAHFGMEIWTTYGKPGEYDFSDSNKQGKEWLTKYADIAIEAQQSRLLR